MQIIESQMTTLLTMFILKAKTPFVSDPLSFYCQHAYPMVDNQNHFPLNTVLYFADIFRLLLHEGSNE